MDPRLFLESRRHSGEFVEQANVLVRKLWKPKSKLTQMNAHSSRSHAVFISHVSGEHASSGTRMEGVLNLVDLAGSERVSRSGASWRAIERSVFDQQEFFVPGDVFAALASKANTCRIEFEIGRLPLAPMFGRRWKDVDVCKRQSRRRFERRNFLLFTFCRESECVRTRAE
ncbi:unnamed protein product [Bathycoccus prasinos]